MFLFIFFPVSVLEGFGSLGEVVFGRGPSKVQQAVTAEVIERLCGPADPPPSEMEPEPPCKTSLTRPQRTCGRGKETYPSQKLSMLCAK